MKRCVAALSLSILGTIAGGCASRGASPEVRLVAEDPDLGELAWLAGSWVVFGPDRRVEEHWTHPAGSTMLGMGRTIVDGATASFEYLRIEHRPEGVVLLASPGGAAPPVTFALTEVGPGRAVFENPQHDFPRRIAYRRDGARLLARTDGGPSAPDGPVLEWAYTRALLAPVE